MAKTNAINNYSEVLAVGVNAEGLTTTNYVLWVQKDQNALSGITLKNANNNAAAQTRFVIESGGISGSLRALSPTFTTDGNKIILAADSGASELNLRADNASGIVTFSPGNAPANAGRMSAAGSGGSNAFLWENSNNTASSQATINISVGGTSSSDAWSQWTVGSTRSYSQGIDTSASQVMTFTTAASATVNPSTATPIWTFTPGTGFNYGLEGTNSFGIGIGTNPTTTIPLSVLKTQNAPSYIRIDNQNTSSQSEARFSLAAATSTEAGMAIGPAAANNTGSLGTNIANKLCVFTNALMDGMIFANAKTGGATFVWVSDMSSLPGTTQMSLAASGSTLSVNNITSLTSGTDLVLSGSGSGVVTFADNLNIQTNNIISTRQTAPGAGAIGQEIISSVAEGTPVALTNNTAANLTSISLTAGVWDLTIVAQFLTNAGVVTGTTQWVISANTISATLGSGDSVNQDGGAARAPVSGVNYINVILPSYRVLVTSTTTWYAVVRGFASTTFTNVSAFGRFRAIRVA